jgi:hypothetical protein
MWREDFERDVATEPAVGRPIHLAHAAGTEGGDDVVMSELAANHRRSSQPGWRIRRRV